MPTTLPKTILLIGASRGLGYAMAAEYLKHGWNVVGTVRGTARTFLHDLADESRSRLEIETVDICEPNQIAALRARLSGRIFDVLFVSAGVTNNPTETIAVVTTAEFVRVMVTNALSPMRVIEALHDLVSPSGTIGIMSSGQGSVSNNTTGMREVYRGKQSGAEHVHAQLRGAPFRGFAYPGPDGPRLGADGYGRSGQAAEHRGERPKPSQCSPLGPGHSRPAISRLSRPHSSLVSHRQVFSIAAEHRSIASPTWPMTVTFPVVDNHSAAP